MRIKYLNKISMVKVILVMLVIGIIAGIGMKIAVKKTSTTSYIPAIVGLFIILGLGIPTYLWGAPIFEFLESIGL